MDSAILELLLKLAPYVIGFYLVIMVSAKLFVSKGIIGDILNIIHYIIRIALIVLAIGLVLVFLGII